MLEERLSGPAMYTIEKDVLDNVDLERFLKILPQVAPKDSF